MTEMKPKKQLAHLFNATRCIGCTACMNACAQTNYGDVMASGKPIHGRVMPGNIQKIVMDGNRRPFQIMSQCQQCTDAPCIKACPFGANYRDPETGQVKIDPKRCMGCNYCITACPYDARWSNPLTPMALSSTALINVGFSSIFAMFSATFLATPPWIWITVPAFLPCGI